MEKDRPVITRKDQPHSSIRYWTRAKGLGRGLRQYYPNIINSDHELARRYRAYIDARKSLKRLVNKINRRGSMDD